MSRSTRLPFGWKILRRFGRHKRGSAAVEFALVAPWFIALLFAIIETGLMFYAGQVLETGTTDASRAFLISQAQNEKFDAAKFKQTICDNVSALFSCSDIYVDVRSFPKGTVVTFTSPLSGGAFVNNTVYQMPTSTDDTVVIRAYYQWPLYVTQLGYNIANIGRGTANSKYLLIATAALRPQ